MRVSLSLVLCAVAALAEAGRSYNDQECWDRWDKWDRHCPVTKTELRYNYGKTLTVTSTKHIISKVPITKTLTSTCTKTITANGKTCTDSTKTITQNNVYTATVTLQPGYVTETVTAVQTQFQIQTQTVTDVQTVTAVQTAQVTDFQTIVQTEVVTEVQTEIETKVVTEIETDVVTEVQTVFVTQVQYQTVVQTEVVTEIEVKTETDIQTQVVTDVVTEVQYQTVVQTQVVTDVVTEVVTDIETVVNTVTDVRYQTVLQTVVQVETHIQTQVQTVVQTQVQTVVQTVVQTSTVNAACAKPTGQNLLYNGGYEDPSQPWLWYSLENSDGTMGRFQGGAYEGSYVYRIKSASGNVETQYLLYDLVFCPGRKYTLVYHAKRISSQSSGSITIKSYLANSLLGTFAVTGSWDDYTLPIWTAPPGLEAGNLRFEFIYSGGGSSSTKEVYMDGVSLVAS